MYAQILPPAGVIEWNRGAGTDAWGTGGLGGNWSGKPAPSGGEDVLFGNAPSGTGALTVEQDTAALALKSLWFTTGRDYTLRGSGSLVLGAGLEDGGRLITVYRPTSGTWGQSENNIDLDLRLNLANGYTAEIANYSAGGLRLGGALDFGQNHLRIGGGSAVHFAGILTGTGKLTVATAAGHVILSADNEATWTGDLEVKHGFLVVTENGALGATSGTVFINGASSGATLAFRPNALETSVDYTSTQAISVSGQGYKRPWGSADPSDENASLNLRPVGAIYNDGGVNHFAGAITLLGNTWFGSRAGELKLSGAISDGGNGYTFTKVGHGLIELSNAANDWSGTTTLGEGVLRISAAGALPSTSALVLNGGILELGAGDFARNLGTAGGEVSWVGDGGFAAYGAARSVTLSGGAGLTWGAGGFIPTGSALLLGSAYANAAVKFTNAINLGNGLREVRVTRGVNSTSFDQLSGKLSGGTGGGLLKTGDGTLWLSNSNNDYRGPTEIRAGVLVGNANIPSGTNGSNIRFSGGVLGLIDEDFKRSLGTGSSQVRWLTRGSEDPALGSGYSGGFAAYGADRTVRFGDNSNNVLTFGLNGSSHIREKSYLIFGAPDSDATVTFDNRIELLRDRGNNIRVVAGTDVSRSVVVFNQQFQGGTSFNGKNSVRDLHFWGDGRVDITKENPNLYIDFVGARGTDLRFRDNGSFLNMRNRYPIEAWWGGSITFDNRDTYVENRLKVVGSGTNGGVNNGDTASIALYAGGFRYWGRGSGTNNSEALARDLRLSIGANFFDMENYVANRYSRFSFYQIGHYNGDSEVDGVYLPGDYHATINFISGNGSNYLTGANSGVQLRFREKPAHIGPIMPYATVKGADWARTEQTGSGSNTWHYLTAYTDYETGNASTWSGGDVVASPSANVVLGNSDRTLNSLRLESGRSVDLNGKKLTLNSGGLLAVGTVGTTITGSAGSTLTAPSGTPFYAHIYNTAAVGLEISTALDLSGSTTRPAFVKTGTGTLLLSGNTSNTISGTTYIHQGVLALGKTGGATAIGGTIIVGDQAGRDTLRLDRSEQIANTATVKLRGGHPDPEHHLMGEGILQFNGAGGRGIRETFAKLEVEGRGVIDFGGGSVGHANFLILDDLDISSFTNYYTASRLFIRNWFEGEDFLLVRRTSANLIGSLSRIEFEGYGPAILRDWNADFYHVTPMPEPATYGIILSAVGLGLMRYAARKRRSGRPTQK